MLRYFFSPTPILIRKTNECTRTRSVLVCVFVTLLHACSIVLFEDACIIKHRRDHLGWRRRTLSRRDARNATWSVFIMWRQWWTRGRPRFHRHPAYVAVKCGDCGGRWKLMRMWGVWKITWCWNESAESIHRIWFAWFITMSGYFIYLFFTPTHLVSCWIWVRARVRVSSRLFRSTYLKPPASKRLLARQTQSVQLMIQDTVWTAK